MDAERRWVAVTQIEGIRPGETAQRQRDAQILTARSVRQIALGLIALQLVVRAWVAARGNFYWDDLVLTGRAGNLPLLSPKFLLYDHDGHFMPAAFLTAGVVTRLAPLRWGAPLVTLVVLQALASLALLRLLRLIVGWRAALLVPLTIVLFSPLTLPSFAWWAAALNALPLQIGLAWVAGDAIMLCWTGRRRYAVSGVAVFAGCLLFFEKAVIVPAVAFAVVALLLHVDGQRQPLHAVARRGAQLWVGSVAVIAVWALLYTSTVRSRLELPKDLGQAIDLLWRAVSKGLLPALLGGPWSWARFGVSSPWGTPPLLLVLLAWVVVLLLAWSTLRRRRHVGWVWVFAAAYVAVDVASMVLGRSGPRTSPVLAQTLRYVADSAVVLAAAAALVLRAPARPSTASRFPPGPSAGTQRALAAVMAGVFAFGCVYSTMTFTRMWADYPTASYLSMARTTLARNAGVPLLDQPVPDDILFALAFPNNLASHVFSPLRDRPDFGRTTPVLRMLDGSGRLVDAHVSKLRSVRPGPAPQCGYRVSGPSRTVLPLDGPLFDWDWTVQLNYLTADNGELEVSLPTGKPVVVPYTRGLNRVYLRLTGSGREIRVLQRSLHRDLCVVSGTVGLVQPGPALGR